MKSDDVEDDVLPVVVVVVVDLAVVVEGRDGGSPAIVVLRSSGKSKLKSEGVVLEVASVVIITIVPVGIPAVVSFFILEL